jgi:hypothetical protein
VPLEPIPANQGQGGQEKAAEQSSFTNALLPVLTVIGTGIGAIGFVIFFGGFVVWSRFEAAGLPANEAVAQVPRSDLVTTGASFLVPALLIALVAAAATVALWDFAIGRKRRTREAKAKADLLRTESQLTQLQDEQARCKEKIALLGPLVGTHATLNAEVAELQSRLKELEDTEIPKVKNERAALVEAWPTVRKSDRREWPLQFAIGGGSMLAAEALVIGLSFGKGICDLDLEYLILLVGAVIATVTVAIVVISMTDHFAWFTLCVFLGVGVTVAASTYVRTQSHVKVSPASMLVGSDPVAGFFVAETGEAVYLGIPDRPRKQKSGELEFDHEAATLVRVSKDSVSGLTIGPIMDEDDAYRRSLVLARALCRNAQTSTVVTERTRTAKGAEARRSRKTELGCTPNRVRRLKQQRTAATGS